MARPAEHLNQGLPTTLSRDEGHKLFDYVARDIVGISGPEFLALYDAGEIAEPGDETRADHDLRYLIMLIPFGR